MNPYPIGIDLGTTNSCCGVYKTDRVELITYNQSERTIPSVISYNTTSTEIVVGYGMLQLLYIVYMILKD